MIFLQQDSCGAIRCMKPKYDDIPVKIKKQDMVGGLREFVIVSNYMM